MNEKFMKKILGIILCLVMVMSAVSCTSQSAGSKTSNEEIDKVLENTGKYLYETVNNPNIGSVGGEWAVIGLVQGKYPVEEGYYESYINNVKEALKEKKGDLDERKYTTYSRVIIALMLLGENPEDIAGYNLIEKLADYNKVISQGINGPVWALIALDSGDYSLPKVDGLKETTTREKLVDYILSKELSGGGWSLSGDEADADITSMAIVSLSPYTESNEKVKSAVDRAIEKLSEMQDEDGGYSSFGEASSESCSQVIVALTYAGVNPIEDERFTKNGNSVIDALLTYKEDNAFVHIKDGEADGMATEQAYLALVACKRYLENKESELLIYSAS